MDIKDKIERVKVQDLKFYPDNPRKHSKEQIEKLAKQIKQVGFNQPIIIDEDNQVMVGNGRLEAADHLNMEELPCIRYSELTQLQKKQLILADNKLNDLSSWDNNLVDTWLRQLSEADMDAYFDVNFDDLENTYSDKIQIPTYEPSEIKPDVDKLVNMKKVKFLIEEINNSDVPADVKEFLRLAAYRHAVFSYKDIASFYANSDKKVQDLMEKSALVIIDFNKAVENGFVEFTESIFEDEEI